MANTVQARHLDGERNGKSKLCIDGLRSANRQNPTGLRVAPASHPASTAKFCLLGKRLQLGQDGGEIFRHRRMDVHGAPYHCMRGFRIHDVQQDVNYFVASGPQDSRTQNLFCFRINSDFDKALCFTFLNGPAHPAHRIFRSECSAPGLSYLGVRHAASALAADQYIERMPGSGLKRGDGQR